jgi:hypothetical protein
VVAGQWQRAAGEHLYAFRSDFSFSLCGGDGPEVFHTAVVSHDWHPRSWERVLADDYWEFRHRRPMHLLAWALAHTADTPSPVSATVFPAPSTASPSVTPPMTRERALRAAAGVFRQLAADAQRAGVALHPLVFKHWGLALEGLGQAKVCCCC